jgi:hypothetical protein
MQVHFPLKSASDSINTYPVVSLVASVVHAMVPNRVGHFRTTIRLPFANQCFGVPHSIAGTVAEAWSAVRC